MKIQKITLNLKNKDLQILKRFVKKIEKNMICSLVRGLNLPRNKKMKKGNFKW